MNERTRARSEIDARSDAARDIPRRRRPTTPLVSGVPEPDEPERIRKFFRFENFFFSWDTSLLITVLILLGFGIIVMFSAGYNFAYREYGDGSHFFNRQIVFAVAGLICMAVLSAVDYRIFKTKFVLVATSVITLALMLAVKLGIGVTQGNAERWLNIFGVTFQPSELAKFAVIILLAAWGSRSMGERDRPPRVRVRYRGGGMLYYLYLKYICMPVRYGFGFAVMVICAACGLTFIQPHLSATIIIGVIGLTIVFLSGERMGNITKFVIFLGVVGLCGVMYMKAVGYTYIDKRILSFVNPEADIGGDTFQTFQSLVAIGSGGFWGVGLGKSHQKYGFLPAAHNDFIFPVICEELGFIGAVFIILLFIIFIWRGLNIALKSRDKFGMLLAAGIVIQIGFQAFLNMAVASNAFFNTGVSLPFFSYGGTALLMQIAEIGIVLNVSRYAKVD